MPTSGSYDFSLTAAQVIQAAWEDLGIIPAGGTATSAQTAMALQRLNILVKQLNASPDLSRGVKVWTRQNVALVLAKGQQSYLIGPAATDARASTLMGRTTLSAAEAAGQTTLSITSNTDTTTYPGTTITMAAADFVGVTLDDGTIQWSAISGTPSTTMDVTVALTGAAASGNYVYWFTSRAQRFPEIEAAVLRDESNTDRPLDTYRDIRQYQLGVSDKYADGTPTAILVEPLRIATRVTLNSQPTDLSERIVLTVLYPQEDYDATSNDIALPQEAFGMLSWELAFMLSPYAGRWTQEMQGNRERAVQIYKNLNPETTDAYFQPG